MSGSRVCAMECMCHRLDHGLYSHLKEFKGNGVRTHVDSKENIPSTRKILPRGGWNPRGCMKQDSEPNTLPTSYLDPYSAHWLWTVAAMETVCWVFSSLFRLLVVCSLTGISLSQQELGKTKEWDGSGGYLTGLTPHFTEPAVLLDFHLGRKEF